MSKIRKEMSSCYFYSYNRSGELLDLKYTTSLSPFYQVVRVWMFQIKCQMPRNPSASIVQIFDLIRTRQKTL